MCLSPIKLYNPSKYISKFGGQKYVMEVPCGECAECRQARRTEIYYRSFYESEFTWKNGGFVYFDTLTYATEHLPMVSTTLGLRDGEEDFSCFRRKDIRLFLVRLRRQLAYYGYENSESLHYFVASEYGSDEEYVDDNGNVRKGTNRPHYHILFFVQFPIDPLVFSELVGKCWQYGHTDGYPYKDALYTMKHVFGPDYNNDQVVMRKVCNYVAKYVLKDNEFSAKLDERMQKVWSRICDYPIDSPIGKREYRNVKRCMAPYTKWSQGFGIYGLQYNSKEDLENGQMKIPCDTPGQPWSWAPLSTYLEHKLYYTTEYYYDREEGKYVGYQTLNPVGRIRALKKAYQSVERFADKFNEWLQNYDQMFLPDEIPGMDAEACKKANERTVKKALELLGDRSPLDFGVYIQFFKGRVKPIKWTSLEDFFYSGLRHWSTYKPYEVLYNYSHSNYYNYFHDKVICESELLAKGEKKRVSKNVYMTEYWINEPRFGQANYQKYDEWYTKTHSDRCWSAEEFGKFCCITDTYMPQFHDFDQLYSLYMSSMYYINERKQKAYDQKEELKKRFKEAGL